MSALWKAAALISCAALGFVPGLVVGQVTEHLTNMQQIDASITEAYNMRQKADDAESEAKGWRAISDKILSDAHGCLHKLASCYGVHR